MNFKELKKNEKLFLHFTLTDTCLFTKKINYAKRIEALLDRGVYDENQVVFQRLLRDTSKTEDEKNSYILAKKDEYFRNHFLEVIESHENWIDIDKYLLTSAFRIRNLLELLENEENRKVFPHFDSFLPYRKTYAETVEEIDRLLDGRHVDISYKAVHGTFPSGYWDEVKQKYIDISYTSEDLKKDLEKGPVRRALELQGDVSKEELEEFSSKSFRISTDDIEVAPEDIRKLVNEMAAKNPNVKVIELGNTSSSDVVPLMDEFINGRAERYGMVSPRITELNRMTRKGENKESSIVSAAYIYNTITDLGKGKFVAVHEGKETIISDYILDYLKKTCKDEILEIEEKIKAGDFDPLIITDIIYKIDNVLLFGLYKDNEIKKSLISSTEMILNRAEKDPEFYTECMQAAMFCFNQIKDKITYDFAASATPSAYIKKYGETDAIKYKYDELQDMFRQKLMYLYSHGLIVGDIILEEGSLATEMTHKELFEAMNAGLLDLPLVRELVVQSSGKVITDIDEKDEYIATLYRASKNDKKTRGKNLSRNYLQILTYDKIIEMFVCEDGLVDESDLRRNKVELLNILELEDGKLLFAAIKSGKLPKNLMPSEEDIFNLYGTKITGQDILDFAKAGIISEKSVLKAYMLGKSLETVEDFEYIKHSDLVEFYDINRLLNMKENGNINSRFVQDFRKEVLDKLNETERKEYFENIVKTLKAIDEESKTESPDYLIKIYELYNLGLFSKEDIKGEFSYENIEALVLDDKITEEDVLKLFNESLADSEIVKALFNDDEVKEFIVSGKLDPKGALIIKKQREKVVKDLLDNDIISVQDVLDFYLDKNDGLDMFEFEAVLKDTELEPGMLVELIPDDIEISKVEELFKKYYISVDDLGILRERGLIKEEKVNELKEYLSSHEEYEKIFGADRRIAILTEDTEGTGNPHGPYPHIPTPGIKKKVKNDPELLRRFLFALGADTRVVHLMGANNSLDGYEVYGFEDLGLMVFGKFDKPNNSTYIMTVAQGSYYLRTLERNANLRKEGENRTSLESIATKQDIRSTENIDSRNACKAWGKNVLASMKNLSPKLKEKLKNDTRYMDRINEIIEEIMVDYELRK